MNSYKHNSSKNECMRKEDGVTFAMDMYGRMEWDAEKNARWLATL